MREEVRAGRRIGHASMLVRRFLSHNVLRTAFRVSRAQALIVSFPKSGRTWLRLMVGKALCTRFGMPDRKALAIDELSSRAGLLRTYVTHDGSAIEDGYTYRQLPVGKQRYAKKRIVLLTRDPKDVLVSSYFHATRRARLYSGDISTFIRDDRYGARKLARFHQIWSEHAHVPAAFMVVRYEDLQARSGNGADRSARVHRPFHGGPGHRASRRDVCGVQQHEEPGAGEAIRARRFCVLARSTMRRVTRSGAVSSAGIAHTSAKTRSATSMRSPKRPGGPSRACRP